MLAALSDQVADAASLVGLLLALVTLFTGEQARRLGDERARAGGSRSERLRSIRLVCIGLGAVTAAALVFLLPLLLDIAGAAGAVGDDEWEPVLGVFALTYLLLLALFCWQVRLARRSS